MAKKKDEIVPDIDAEGIRGEFPQDIPVIHKMKPVHVSVDFPSEGLNNLARKINEIIDYL